MADRKGREGSGLFRFENIHLKNSKGEETESVFCNSALSLDLYYSYRNIDISRVIISVGFKDPNNELIAFFTTDEMGFCLNKEINQFNLNIPAHGLRPGTYSIWLLATYDTTSPADFCDAIDAATTITVLANDLWVAGKMIRSRNTAFFDGTYSQNNF